MTSCCTDPTAAPTTSPTISSSTSPAIVPTISPTLSVCNKATQTEQTNNVCLFLYDIDDTIWFENGTFLTLTEPDFCNITQLFACEDGQITEIKMSSSGLNGTINSTFVANLPDSIKVLDFGNNSLRGDVGFWEQIYRFERVDLSYNSFSGDINFSQPAGVPVLKELYLNNNNWDEQSMSWNDFQYYPNLEKLDLSNNRFIGTITFENVENLVYLNIENNQFTDIYDFYNLNHLEFLTELYMSNNRIREDLNLSSLPSSLEVLDCDNNRFTGELEMNSIPKSLIVFDCGDNSFEDLNWPYTYVADGDEYALEYLSMFRNMLLFSVFE